VSFAEAVKNLREHLGFTQERMARELGSTLKTISRYESAAVEPRGKFLDALVTLSTKAERGDLVRVFVQKRNEAIRSSLSASLKHSRGSARRIPQWELVALNHSLAALRINLGVLRGKIGKRSDLRKPLTSAEAIASDIWKTVDHWLGKSGESPKE
jgi:transcriptional regulator with XRE-family HTH domain